MDLFSETRNTEYKNNRNEAFLAFPNIIKFLYKESSPREETELRLINVSNLSKRLRIFPPYSKYFKIKYQEKGWIAPGLSLLVKVSFEPNRRDRSRHYKDCIRIICDTGYGCIQKDVILNASTFALNKSILSVPLLALPHNVHSDLPDEIHFGYVKLGKRVLSRFKISPMAGHVVKYFFVTPEKYSDFYITPMQGILKENDPPAVITVEFAPSTYRMHELFIKLFIPCSSITPYIIKLTGICKAWKINQADEFLSKERVRKSNILPKENPPGVITDDALQNKGSMNHNEPIVVTHPSAKKKNQKPETIEIPLNTIYGISKFLSKKPNKERDPYFDLIGPLGMCQEDEKAITDELERKFMEKVNKDRERHRYLFFKNETEVGPSPNDPLIEELAEIEIDRIIMQKNYEDMQVLEKPDTLFASAQGFNLRRRVLREVDEGNGLNFTAQPTSEWFIRNMILSRFIQAVRKVIIRDRLVRRLHLITVGASKEEEEKNDPNQLKSSTEEAENLKWNYRSATF